MVDTGILLVLFALEFSHAFLTAVDKGLDGFLVFGHADFTGTTLGLVTASLDFPLCLVIFPEIAVTGPGFGTGSPVLQGHLQQFHTELRPLPRAFDTEQETALHCYLGIGCGGIKVRGRGCALAAVIVGMVYRYDFRCQRGAGTVRNPPGIVENQIPGLAAVPVTVCRFRFPSEQGVEGSCIHPTFRALDPLQGIGPGQALEGRAGNERRAVGVMQGDCGLQRADAAGTNEQTPLHLSRPQCCFPAGAGLQYQFIPALIGGLIHLGHR